MLAAYARAMRTYAVRLVALVGLLLGAVVVPASVAAACSCGPATPDEVVSRNSVVVTGTVEDVDDPGGASSPHDVVWTVNVKQVHRGTAAATSYLVAQDGCGPVAPEPGRLQVLVAAARDGSLVLDSCQGLADPTSGTGGAMLAAAGTASPPSPAGPGVVGSVAPDLPGGGMSLVTMLVIGLVGLLVVTLGGLALAVGLGFLTTRRGSGERGRGGGGKGDAAGSGDATSRMSDSSETPPS